MHRMDPFHLFKLLPLRPRAGTPSLGLTPTPTILLREPSRTSRSKVELQEAIQVEVILPEEEVAGAIQALEEEDTTAQVADSLPEAVAYHLEEAVSSLAADPEGEETSSALLACATPVSARMDRRALRSALTAGGLLVFAIKVVEEAPADQEVQADQVAQEDRAETSQGALEHLDVERALPCPSLLLGARREKGSSGG